MRHILHADLDAFYASVEQLDNPHLRGKPVVVGGSPAVRGVVASASYEARKYNIRSAMPMRTALQYCPEVIRVSPRFVRYRNVSRKVMGIFNDLSLLVEPLSLDEAFLDITDRVTLAKPPKNIARLLKWRVKDQLGLDISVGVATNKSVAKIASDLDKPNGLTVVPPGTERTFLASLPVSRIWGIGPKTQKRLKTMGIEIIEELAKQSEDWMRQNFGRSGPQMREFAQGIDNRLVQTKRTTKSVSSETTLIQDTGDADALEELVNRLSHDVALDLERKSLWARTIKLKLRLSDFTTFTRQITLLEPVQTSDQIAESANMLLTSELGRDRLFRLVGVGASSFEQSTEIKIRQPRLPGV